MGANRVELEALRSEMHRQIDASFHALVKAGLAQPDPEGALRIHLSRGGLSLVTATVRVDPVSLRATAEVEDHLSGFTYEVRCRAPEGDRPMQLAATVLTVASDASRMDT